MLSSNKRVENPWIRALEHTTLLYDRSVSVAAVYDECVVGVGAAAAAGVWNGFQQR